jgi:hypothetical protein
MYLHAIPDMIRERKFEQLRLWMEIAATEGLPIALVALASTTMREREETLCKTQKLS